MFPRRKLLGKQLAGAKAFAANPDPAAAGSALCAHFSRGCEKCGLRGESSIPTASKGSLQKERGRFAESALLPTRSFNLAVLRRGGSGYSNRIPCARGRSEP